MKVSESGLKAFIEAYQAEFDEHLSAADAEELMMPLITIMRELAQTLPNESHHENPLVES